MCVAIGIFRQAANIEDLLGIVALRFIQHFHRGRVGGQFVDQRQVIVVGRNVAGNGGAHLHVIRRIGHRLHDPRAFRIGEIDVAHIHQLHRSG